VTPVTKATKVTFSLIAKGKTVMHYGFMNQYDDVELGTRLLPGVDLALWLQIIVTVLFVLAVGGLALALA
jgi:hypothetical protein